MPPKFNRGNMDALSKHLSIDDLNMMKQVDKNTCSS